MVKKEIREIIKEYVKKLNEKSIPIEKAILFGSQSNGTAKVDSDIDLMLVTQDRIPKKISSRTAWLTADEIDYRIEPIVVTKSKYEANDTVLVDLVHKTGISIS
ncbi:nucleotidyltransferase domain-containing protein [Candidatus Kapabacteria bacterium]|nr:nucleotidyltransferase domain-containing protein [Candidatus Kapabacteria bacterium]